MVDLLKEDCTRPADHRFWTWALSILKRYGADSMSSEESGVDDRLGRRGTILRVKIMPWRRQIENLIEVIESTKQTDRRLFCNRGPPPMDRIRPDHNSLPSNWPRTSRAPVENLPFVFYDEKWFNSVSPEVRRTTLHATSEEFNWFHGIGYNV
jgi:hypothetical protein